MLHTLSLVLRIIIGVGGITLVYASFSYEDEDARIQSLIEEWWIRIDDLRQHAISSHVAFMKVLASVLTSFFDRLFGTRILSFQSLGVSICYSIVCFGVTVFLLSRLNPTPEADASSLLWLAAFGIVYGTIPALLPKDIWHLRWLSWVQVWFWLLVIKGFWLFLNPLGFIIVFGLTHSSDFTPEQQVGGVVFLLLILAVSFSLILAMLMFTAFVGIMRATLRTIARSQSPMKITGLTLLNATPVISFYGIIKGLEVSAAYEGLGKLLFFLLLLVLILTLMFNLAFVLSGVLFVALAVLMLLHRLFYPTIQRPLYKLQALGISKRPKVFAAIGVVLLGIAFGKLEWLKSILDKLF